MCIQHLIVIVQENHTFDDHFGAYCTAATGSNPTCTDGPACCEAMPATDPSGTKPTVLTDSVHAASSPNHAQSCELSELDNGRKQQDRVQQRHLVDDPKPKAAFRSECLGRASRPIAVQIKSL